MIKIFCDECGEEMKRRYGCLSIRMERNEEDMDFPRDLDKYEELCKKCYNMLLRKKYD